MGPSSIKHHQQQQQHHQQLKDQQINKLLHPPQYQPPPPPVFKSNPGNIPLQQQQQHLQHQQQTLRLANPLKDPSSGCKVSQKVSDSNIIPPSMIQPAQKVNPQLYCPVNKNIHYNRTNRISDEDFLKLSPVEMLKFVRKTESDIARLAAEQNRQIQNLLCEIRALKEANQRLSDDNQELRDLCCFLDDDRQKGRKLAREWQRFGRYTASVMRQEVSAYQNKLRQLDNKQQELIKDNLELKELCLYLDEERGGVQRDDGDGSSSSTNADETTPRVRQYSIFNDQTMQYVRSLEQRVKQLEEDKSQLLAKSQKDNPTSGSDNLTGRPEAVVQALQVLEVREQWENNGKDDEKALIREMCNVVWRKLEEGSQTKR